MFAAQATLVEGMFASMRDAISVSHPTHSDLADPASLNQAWSEALAGMQEQWLALAPHASGLAASPDDASGAGDPVEAWRQWWEHLSLAAAGQQALAREAAALWQAVLAQFANGGEPALEDLPRRDKRFADPAWRANPATALLHQTYLLLSERQVEAAGTMPGLAEEKRAQARFFAKALADAASPANFAATNPAAMNRAAETGGESLARGMQHLLEDLRKGQLTHTDPAAFELGRNIASTPGKVVHRTPLYELIQYSPTTDEVLETPLVIFPPWINRFYILDLNEKKSFVRWAVAQGVTVFMVSWKSADATLSELEWSDYICAQIEAIDHVRDLLEVERVHTIGYCVAGTTLAATLALLAARDEADKVASATFLTAQVDFADAGDLLHFVDDTQLAAVEQLATNGYLDGRFMAAAFNLLRGNDLIWNYVVNHYLMGEEYPAFDLLHWNGDVTNLPARWHQAYLRDLYRDNRLVEPGGVTIEGTPIDLALVTTPCYVQAGREDHIAPAKSVWRITDHFSGPLRFVLAGSGHIAGVVNPPDANKYQYWTHEGGPDSFEGFVAGAEEHAGSWWPDWVGWLRSETPALIAATGKRQPGENGGAVLEDAPGSYVKLR
jgi:polyhydroxyalkanoate synthase